MFQIIGIAIISGILIIQRLLKTRSVKTGEVVIYDTNSPKGKIHSLITRIKTLQLIILLTITVIGSVITRNYRTLKNIQAISENGQYELAHQLIEESKNGFIPLLFSRDLNYHNNINWAISRIDNEEWNEAVVPLNSLIEQDSIPSNLICTAFDAFAQYIMLNDPNKIYPKRFNQVIIESPNCKIIKNGCEAIAHDYSEYCLKNNIPEKIVTNAYELWESMLKLNSTEALYYKAKQTRNITDIEDLLNTQNEEWVTRFLIDFSSDTKTSISWIDCLDYNEESSRYYFNMEKFWINDSLDNVMSLRLVELCDLKSIFTTALIARELKLREKWIDNKKVLPELSDLPYSHEKRRKIDRDLKNSSVPIINAILWNMSDDFRENFINQMTLENYILRARKERNEWELRDGEKWFARGQLGYELNSYKSLIYYTAQALDRSSSRFRAVKLYEKALKFEEEVLSIINLDARSNDYPYKLDILTSLAFAKWNIKPYGPKMGYCEDLRKAIELGAPDDIITVYYLSCE